MSYEASLLRRRHDAHDIAAAMPAAAMMCHAAAMQRCCRDAFRQIYGTPMCVYAAEILA